MGPKGIPSLTHHRASGQAVVRLDGKDHYCGSWDRKANQPSRHAQAKYHRLIAEWVASDHATSNITDEGATVSEICEGYLRHARTYYVKNGQLSQHTLRRFPEAYRCGLIAG